MERPRLLASLRCLCDACDATAGLAAGIDAAPREVDGGALGALGP